MKTTEVKELLGEKPLVLDREFSYLALMQALVIEEVNFVIRLKLGAHSFDQEGKQVSLNVKKGETRINPYIYFISSNSAAKLCTRWMAST